MNVNGGIMKDAMAISAAISGGTVAYKAPQLADTTQQVSGIVMTLPLFLQLVGALVGLIGVIVAAFRGYVAWKEFKLKEKIEERKHAETTHSKSEEEASYHREKQEEER